MLIYLGIHIFAIIWFIYIFESTGYKPTPGEQVFVSLFAPIIFIMILVLQALDTEEK